ncbi:MAG TPA: type VI secretion system tip protein TssI/VgrG [Janthinobacterium sp.]|nr:type VI secretion system tip protein TssI/VgrG [Janthinobacterium sp.]
MNLFQGDTAALAALDRDMQGRRLLRLDFPRRDGPDDVLMLANSLEADEGLSRDFCYTVEVLSDDAGIPLTAVMGKMVTISLLREDGTPRYFNGHVFEFAFVRTDGGFAFYRMVLKPWLAWLRLGRDSVVFQHLSLTEICDQTFQRYLQRDYRYRLAGALPTLTMAVQFNESDYNHLHRRLEDAGLFYWYEHRFDGHTWWLGDDSTGAGPIDGERSDMPYRMQGGAGEDDGVQRWSAQRRVGPGLTTLGSYDFKRARPDRAGRASLNRQGAVPVLELYESTGAYGFRDDDGGVALAARRMEAQDARGQDFDAGGNDRTAQPGRWFTLSGHFSGGRARSAPGEALGGDVGAREYLILSVRHSASNNYQDGRAALSSYRNRFTCLRKSIPWRPQRGFQSSAVCIPGAQTAKVVGPAGEEIHTDRYGRVRVQFHWDRLGKYDAASSPWVRVMTSWAGANFGQISLPRVGQEVVVQFLDGNPDRPLIVGGVYNESHMPPWELPANKTQSGILTRSSNGGRAAHANALRFEDMKGEEELWLHAEKNQRIEVEHDESHWVGNDRNKTVLRDEGVDVGRDRHETVGRDETITVHGERRERVGRDEQIRIHGEKNERVDLAKTETVGLAKALSVGGLYQVSVGAAMNTTVALSQTAQVLGGKSTRVGKAYGIEAGEELAIEVGAASFRMSRDGTITLGGTRIDIEASGPVRINGKDVDINMGGAALAGGVASAANTVPGKDADKNDNASERNTAGEAPTSPDNRSLLNAADAELHSRPAITRAEDLKNISSPATAPKTIVIADNMQNDFNSLWGKSFPAGHSQEFGGVIVTDKNGELSMTNMGTDSQKDSYFPNLNITDKKEVIGTFHTHPYDNPPHTDVSFSGTDAAYIVNTKQVLAICQSGTGQFAFLRTSMTPASVNEPEIKKQVQDETNRLVLLGGMPFDAASKQSAKDVAKELNLGYYEGENGKLNLIDNK